MYVCMYVCICICIYEAYGRHGAYMCLLGITCMFTYTYAYIHTYESGHHGTCMCPLDYTYIHIHIYMRTYI